MGDNLRLLLRPEVVEARERDEGGARRRGCNTGKRPVIRPAPLRTREQQDIRGYGFVACAGTVKPCGGEVLADRGREQLLLPLAFLASDRQRQADLQQPGRRPAGGRIRASSEGDEGVELPAAGELRARAPTHSVRGEIPGS